MRMEHKQSHSSSVRSAKFAFDCSKSEAERCVWLKTKRKVDKKNTVTAFHGNLISFFLLMKIMHSVANGTKHHWTVTELHLRNSFHFQPFASLIRCFGSWKSFEWHLNLRSSNRPNEKRLRRVETKTKSFPIFAVGFHHWRSVKSIAACVCVCEFNFPINSILCEASALR